VIPQVLQSGLLVRRAGPADAAALQSLVSRSDVMSRYSRFHGAMKRLPSSYLHLLVDRPASEHDALVVEVDGRLVAFGDLGPVPGEPGVVEVGILVETPYRRQGIARLLLDELAVRAAARGMSVLRAVVLHDHVPEVKPLLGDRPVLRSWTDASSHGFDLALTRPEDLGRRDGVQDVEPGRASGRQRRREDTPEGRRQQDLADACEGDRELRDALVLQ
jgi:GNAT superfamily N-acetyltransferase